MKVDYLSIHFKNSMIPSRTKHESFDSFGSHAQCKFPYLYCYCNEPILYSLVIYSTKYQKESLIQDQNIRRTLLTKQKICNCQQSCLLFLIQEVFLTLYTIHRSSIQHWLKKGRKSPISSSNHFINMSVLY